MGTTRTDAERHKLLADILSEHSRSAIEGAPLPVCLEQLVMGACELTDTPLHLGGIRVVNPDTLARRLDVPFDGLVFDTAAMEFDQLLLRATAERMPITVDDIDVHSPLGDYGMRSQLIIPLLVEYHCWGALYLQSTEPHHFTAACLPFVEALGRQAALTIQADDLQARAELAWEATPRLHSGFPSQPAAPRFGELQESLRLVVRDVIDRLGGRPAVAEVLLFNDQRNALATLAVASEPPGIGLAGYAAKGASTVAWAAVSAGETIKLDNLHEDPRASMPDTVAALAIPLRDDWGRVVGVLNLESPADFILANPEVQIRPHCERVEEILAVTDSATLAIASSPESVMSSIKEQAPQLVDPDNLEGLYKLVLRRAAQLVGLPDLQLAIAFLDRVDDQYLTITPHRTFQYPLKWVKTWSWRVSKSITGQAVLTSQPQLVPDVTVLKEGKDYIKQDDSIRSELAVPLLRERQAAFGVLDVSSPHAEPLQQRHLQLVSAFATAVSVALDRAERIRSFKALARQSDAIGNTNKMIHVMLSETSLDGLRRGRDKVLAELVNAARDLTNANYGTIVEAVELPEGLSRSQWGADTELVRIVAQPPADMELRQHWHASRGVTGSAFGEKRRQDIPDVHEYRARGGEYIALYGPHIRSELAVPILSGDRVVGILNLESEESRMFSPGQIDGVQLLASQIGTVLSAFDSQLALSKLHRLSSVLDHIMRDTLATHDAPEEPISRDIQQAILKAALELTGQDTGYASLWFMHDDGPRLHGWLPKSTRVRDRRKEGLVRLAREWRQPVHALDVSDPAWRDQVQRNWSETRSELAVPLLRSEPDDENSPPRVLGVLNVESALVAGFTLADIDILQVLAQAAVVAMHNHEQYRNRGELMGELIHATRKPMLPLCAAVRALRQEGGVPTREGFQGQTYHQHVENIDVLIKLSDRSLSWFNCLANHENGKERAKMAHQRLDDVMKQMVRDMNAYLHALGDQRDIEEHIAQPIRIRCARPLIEAALFLLIENAFTHGPEDVQVAATLLRLDEATARVEVSNTGEPIPREKQDSMWARGIGLQHVKRIIEGIHGGRVGYEPRDGWNVFIIEVPAARPRKQSQRRTTMAARARIQKGES